MKFLLGTKKYMTQLFDEEGRAYPATVLEAGPVFVTQIKNAERDGYEAVQIGFGTRAKKNVSKALAGHTAAGAKGVEMAEDKVPAQVMEYRLKKAGELGELEVGAVLDVSSFAEGDKVTVSATSKGKGFQGVVKRHGFAGGPRTHGQKHHERAPGSIGSTGPQKVNKGTRMPGRMGAKRVSVKNLKVLRIDPGQNLLVVKGAVPGPRGALVEIRG